MMGRYWSRYRERIQAAAQERRDLDAPPLRILVLTMVGLVSSYIVLAIFLVPPSKPRAYNFVDERGAVTVLSGIFLAMGCGFSLATFLLSDGQPRTRRIFWFLAVLTIGFLAMDELLGFHELVGRWLDERDALSVKSEQTFRHWNDVIVILYGVIAAPIAGWFLPTILRYPRLFELLSIAAGCYVVHTAIDSLVEPPTTASIVCEESAKLFCGAFMALGLLYGLWTTAWNCRHSGSSETPSH